MRLSIRYSYTGCVPLSRSGINVTLLSRLTNDYSFVTSHSQKHTNAHAQFVVILPMNLIACRRVTCLMDMDIDIPCMIGHPTTQHNPVVSATYDDVDRVVARARRRLNFNFSFKFKSGLIESCPGSRAVTLSPICVVMLRIVRDDLR